MRKSIAKVANWGTEKPTGKSIMAIEKWANNQGIDIGTTNSSRLSPQMIQHPIKEAPPILTLFPK